MYRSDTMLLWLPLGGSASLALDSIEVMWAGNSGVWSTAEDMLPDVDRYCDVGFIERPCMLVCSEGVAKLKLADGCSDEAVDVEKLGEN